MENRNLILIAQFCLHHQIERSFIASLHEFGLISVFMVDHEDYVYSDELGKLEKMIRLHFDLGINFEGIDAIYGLLKKIETLQMELTLTKNRLNAFAPSVHDKSQLKH